MNNKFQKEKKGKTNLKISPSDIKKAEYNPFKQDILKNLFITVLSVCGCATLYKMANLQDYQFVNYALNMVNFGLAARLTGSILGYFNYKNSSNSKNMSKEEFLKQQHYTYGKMYGKTDEQYMNEMRKRGGR